MPVDMPGPPSPSRPDRLACTGLVRDSPFEGHLLWDFALVTPGSTRSAHVVFFHTLKMGCSPAWQRQQTPGLRRAEQAWPALP